MISDKKWTALKIWMKQLGIKEDALIETFVKGFGRGGQKLNTSSNCVLLQYKAFDISIKCQKYRCRENNRYQARKQLCERVDALINPKNNVSTKLKNKIKKQKKRRLRRHQNKNSE